jgi:hypothetical protein
MTVAQTTRYSKDAPVAGVSLVGPIGVTPISD